MSFGPKDRPFKCDEIHVIWRTPKQRRRRFAKVAKWGKRGYLPKKGIPAWVTWKKNHGGDGGP